MLSAPLIIYHTKGEVHPMRIATWNVERLKRHREITSILREIENADADILVLTETDARLLPHYPYAFQTPPLHQTPPDNRITHQS